MTAFPHVSTGNPQKSKINGASGCGQWAKARCVALTKSLALLITTIRSYSIGPPIPHATPARQQALAPRVDCTPRTSMTTVLVNSDIDSATSVTLAPRTPPPQHERRRPRAGHRRTSTLGSAVTDEWASPSADTPPTLPPPTRRIRSHPSPTPTPTSSSSTTQEQPRRRRARTLHDPPSTALTSLADPDTVNAHINALVALRRMERACRRAEALLASDAPTRAQRRAWILVNAQHRVAVSSAEHIRLWAAAYSPRTGDPDVAAGSAALPGYHAPFVFAPAARRERRAAALAHARRLALHLCARQSRMLEYLSLASDLPVPVFKRYSCA